MKRPRTNQYSKNEESFMISCLDGNSISTASGVGLSESAPRRWNSCRRRFRRSLRLGSCLVSTLALAVGFVSFAILPMADASKASTSGIESDVTMTYLGVNHDASRQQLWDNNPRGRRIEQQRRAPKGKNKREHRHLQEEKDKGVSFDSSLESPPSSSSLPVMSLSPEDECTIPAGKCTECTFSERKTYEACQVTGKWQTFECIVAAEPEARRTEQEASSSTSSSSSDAVFQMQSCKYTEFDEGFAMFELQIFCLLIGCLAVVSVRKQKRLSSNMFDRRKQQGSNANANANAIMRSNSGVGTSRRSTDRVLEHGDEIEFTPMTNQEKEKVPLMEIQGDHMEII